MTVHFACTEPGCEIAGTPFGLSAGEIALRASAARARARTEPLVADAKDETQYPCPLCESAGRLGKLVAIPADGELGGVINAFGAPWRSVELATRATYGMLTKAGHAKGTAPTPKSKLVIGEKVVVAQVLRTLPYDGHLLAFGNRDAKVWRDGGGRPKEEGPGDPATYGSPAAAPLPAARADPTYVRELQRDLILLGYYSRGRGTRRIGKFDVHTLGGVLALKQDLVEIYGIATTDSPREVSAATIDVESFAEPILFQPVLRPPARIVEMWDAGIVRGGLSTAVERIGTLASRLGSAKTEKTFGSKLQALSRAADRLSTLCNALPERWALEDPAGSMAPFKPWLSKVAISDLPPRPATGPRHATMKAMLADPVWTRDAYGGRAKAHRPFSKLIKKLSARITRGLSPKSGGAKALERVEAITAPAGAEADWTSAKPAVVTALMEAMKLLELVEYWLLNLPVQVEAWLDHITRLGSVDQATAVYIKALLEGGRIGPKKRAGYRIPTNIDDFGSADEGAQFLRDTLIALGPNEDKKPAKTMPEILALQMYGNESGMRLTFKLSWYAVDPKEANLTFPKLGVDWNTTGRAGTFDAIHASFLLDGEFDANNQGWVLSRGWGLGQETEGSGKGFGGMRLRHGLPVVPREATHVEHPAAFTSTTASFTSVLEGKALSRYNGKRDCSFETKYDCHNCLKRFFDLGLVGSDEDGEGSVFVPIGRGTFGGISDAENVWVDLERVTQWAQAGGKHDPSRVADYKELFEKTGDPRHALEPLPGKPSALVLEVLQSDAVVDISNAAASVAEDHGIEAAPLEAEVKAYVAARRNLPCSWFRVRIRYTGTGPQAWGSLFKMMRIVGKLEGASKVCTKHIEEASELRTSGSVK